MPFAPELTRSFSDPRLLAVVLGDPTFARRGYLWGSDGHVHYCFLNPNKVRLEVWRKRFHWWALLGLLTGPLAPFTILVLARHFVRTAKEQAAAVMTNGPQMQLPGNLQSEQTVALLVALVAVPTLALGILGFILGATGGTLVLPVVGSISGGLGIGLFGTAVGAITGLDLLAVVLFVLGERAVPFNDVVSPPHSEKGAGVAGTYHFGRTAGTAVSSYRVGADEPTGLTWASGGLTAMVLNGVPVSAAGGTVAATYKRVIARKIAMVLWGLVIWNPSVDTSLVEAINTQRENYGPEGMPAGLILVAGARPWTGADTASMIIQKTIDAVATDGSLSALLGSSDEVVPELETWTLLDPIQRYGLKCVPE